MFPGRLAVGWAVAVAVRARIHIPGGGAPPRRDRAQARCRPLDKALGSSCSGDSSPSPAPPGSQHIVLVTVRSWWDPGGDTRVGPSLWYNEKLTFAPLGPAPGAELLQSLQFTVLWLLMRDWRPGAPRWLLLGAAHQGDEISS